MTAKAGVITRIGKQAVESLAIAIVYIATAQPGFLIAIPPGNVTVVWPPSGIALAAVALLGYRAAAGVWLGSFLVNLLFFVSHQVAPPTGIAAASGIATGSMLQAVLAAFLYRHVVGTQLPHGLKGACSFMAISASSCLVAATAGSSSLALNGAIAWSDYWSTWSTWWLGDLVGTLTVAPILLIVGYRTRRRNGTAHWMFPAVCGAAGVLVLAAYNSRSITGSWEADYFGVDPDWVAWGVFGIGLLLAILLASYIEYYLGVKAGLEESQERSHRQLLELETLYRTAPIGLALVDRELRYRRMNQRLADINGAPIEACIGRTIRAVAPGVADTIEPLYRQVFETGQPVRNMEVHGTTPARPGVPRDWLVDYYPIQEPDDTVQAVAAMVVEVTEQKRSAKALQHSEQRFRDFAAAASDWFWETDAEHRFVWMSANVERLTGVPREQSYGKSRFELMVPGTDQAVIEEHRAALAARQPFRELEYLRHGPNGDFWLSTSGVPVFDVDGQFLGYRGVGREIGARKSAEARTRYLAHHDELTGLPNRSLLRDRLRQALVHAHRTGEHISLLLLDLDRFKEVNDALGHPAGDQLLQTVAKRLARVVRASDTLARLGGDEFAVVQTNVQAADGTVALAERLIEAIAAPLVMDGQQIKIASSIGIAVHPEDSADADELVRRADMALYRAKHEGRGRFRFFEPAMDVRARQRRQLEYDLRRALDASEFVLHYQPQVELATGRVLGVEALIRWRHPTRGLVPPGEFIPVAEACGLIIHLGAWALGEACRQVRTWQNVGVMLTVAVNLSPVQVRHEGLLLIVDAALDAHQLDGSWLEVELTEGLLLDRSEGTAADTLRGLATRGVRLALDDFGTGYSSLGYLKRLPVQRIKIDRSFVGDIGSDPEDEAVVRAIITMAHTLGKQVVAEGVETPAQLAFLRALGCDAAQGFLLGRPTEAARIAPLLAA